MSRVGRSWLAVIVPPVLVAVIAGFIAQPNPLWTTMLAGAGALLGLAAQWLFTGERSDGADDPHMPAPSSQRAMARPSSDLFEAVLGTMIDGVVVTNPSLTLLYINRTARNLLDVGDRPVVGKLLSEVSRSAPLQDVIETAFRTRSHQRTELQLTRQKLTLAVSAAPLNVDPSGGILIVLHDVTELRRLERMRREFVSNVSHELKTPLTSIQAYSDTLLSGGLDDEAHRQSFVERIQEQADRLQTLILDLLRLARIESDDVAFEIHSVDVSEVVTECIEDRSKVATSKGLRLEMKPPATPVVAHAEAEGLRTILSNLIENAINYTPAGGTVEVSWSARDGMVEIVVSDTGVGIPKEHQGRVFERFYRVDRARSRALGGTGLGLSIVKHLAQAFGGRVELESEQGHGSRFIVWLPEGNR
ncbi:MAG TPA: ATP-binding protein [Caulifigura sp.]|jgi:two-component system phosphate regulon sensor histidine kinase PhoR|nr:ATP-binding protein [Caulifigura sp.]